MKIKSIIIFLSILIIPTAIFAQPNVVEVFLAEDIVNRQPFQPFANDLTCDPEDYDEPTIDAQEYATIYFWTKINNDEARYFNHVWEMELEGDWEVVSEVNLNVGRSGGWRTWSSKNLDPIMHVGAWRVQVSADDDPDNVLCSVFFNIE